MIKLRRAVTTGRPARRCWQKGMRHDHTDDCRLSRVEKVIPVDKDERGLFAFRSGRER